MERQSGYYWVKFKGDWRIAFYNRDIKKWIVCGEPSMYIAAEFKEINECRIDRKD